MPRAFLSVLLGVAALGTGCTSYRTVAIDEGAQIQVRSFESVKLAFTDGRTIRAESVQLDVDSTSWVDSATREVHAVPTVEVAWVDRVQHRKGAIQGATVAFLTLATLVTIRHMVGNGLQQERNVGRDLGAGARVGLMAAPVGAVVGSIVGARQRSVFTVGPVYIGPEPSIVPRGRQ